MTTTEMTPPSPPSQVRRLRRSRSDRIGAGVAGGLGEYFGVDPVLFRVLFATAAFFGGAGVLAYLLAWAAIPEEGTERAVIDGWVEALRRRRVPFFLVVAGAAFLFWLIAFSWWAPGPFLPVIVVVIILVAVLGRRGRAPAPPPPPISLVKDGGPAPTASAPTTPPVWADETRQWLRDAREARRARLRRALPVKIATLATFAVAMVVLGLIDAARGIPVATYFWFALGILGVGLLVGLATRRASWGVAALLLPVIIGTVALAGTEASLADGIGQKQWQPTTRPAASYRLAFGQGVLDLRSLPVLTSPAHVRIDVAAGDVKILAARTLNVVVDANVHFGEIDVDGQTYDAGFKSHGVNVSRTINPPASATGPQVVVDVHLADGRISVLHR